MEKDEEKEDSDSGSFFDDRRRYETRWILANLYTIGYFGILMMTYYVSPPTGNEDAIKLLLGALTIIEGTIVNYYFGSSRDVAAAVAAVSNKTRKDGKE